MRLLLVPCAVVVATILVGACGSESGDSPNNPGNDGGNIGFDNIDGGDGGGDGAADGSLSGACPPYQTACNGKCIPTIADPNNCGGCGKSCTGDTACSGGVCGTTCLPGLTLCKNDHTCADTENDNDHCGNCTNKCPAGKGCVAGHCENSVPLNPAPAACTGGGPPIVNAPDKGGCLGSLAATTFRWTLCSCKDVSLSSLLFVDAYDSTQGPYVPGGIGGGVGANGLYSSSSNTDVWGDLWSSSATGLSSSAEQMIKHELRSGGRIATSSKIDIGADAYAKGDLTGKITIGGQLHVPNDANVGASVTSKGVTRAPVSFPNACDCRPEQLVPIGGMLAAHVSPNNDNATIGLDPDVLATPTAPTRLDLPCGNYYLSEIHPSVGVTIWAHGRTALYIGKDVTSSAPIAFGVDPNGELDVFIAGRLSTSSKLTIGSPNYPALTRTYVGSDNGLALSATASIGGNLYAAYGPVSWSANTAAYGSIFAGDFHASAPTLIHYDRAVLQAGVACPAPGGGPTPAGCSSCRDCGNQACTGGKCGACTTSAECCSPLVCESGSCVPAIKVN
jgi:hypothetical protein